ncbi:TetR/AcrR family transcriptional regulator [Nesterenkonia muleiensis]|uniref:TetR/AcrR family transcriptional regulator n=1 Tax=Nesterenkonia muleiensis TaxID=2282648 RepID=UPI000E7207C0|nr:TetR/AcrR family transcriptional regulator [Nesterenkonia muleiensis]
MTSIDKTAGQPPTEGRGRRKRADAERNLSALLDSAKTVFATSGVHAPAKEITDAAGLGVGTLYRHFPRRADLVVAVLRHEIDACAEAASAMRAQHAPYEALRQWVNRYVELVGTKRGLAEALHSGDQAFEGLRDDVAQRLEPVVAELIADARAVEEMAAELDARELLYAIGLLCQPVPAADISEDYNHRMVAVFVEGLRHSPS